MESIVSKKSENETIAEFMGGVKTDKFNLNGHPIYKFPKDLPIRLNSDSVGKKETGYLEDFQTSWDWLMPVVEKIEAQRYDTRIQHFTAIVDGKETVHTWCTIEDVVGTVIAHVEGNTKIEAVYKAVVKFIEWHGNSK